MYSRSLLTYALVSFLCFLSLHAQAQSWTNHTYTYDTSDHPYGYMRHECGATLLDIDGEPVGVLIGGRGSNRKAIYYHPRNAYVDVADTKAPYEIHHVQAVTWRDSIAIIGMGFEGGYPNETPSENILAYYYKSQTFSTLTTVPSTRQRGSAMSIIDGDWLYYFCGIKEGHTGGWVSWVDRYNLSTGVWEQLADAPRARDHGFAVKEGNKVYLLGGRNSNATGLGLNALMVEEVDVFDLSTLKWESSPISLPTTRAGILVDAQLNSSNELEISVWGGENDSGTLTSGDLLNMNTLTITSLPNLTFPTHASGLFRIPNTDSLYLVAGAYLSGYENEIGWPNYVQSYQSSGIFPVEWLDVRAQKGAYGVKLSWHVAESNVRHYQIQRRGENSLWEQIASLNSVGDGENFYEFDDPEAQKTSNLNYRILSVDYDGTISYSKTLEIQAGGEMFVYPNPLNPKLESLKFNQEVELAELFDLTGRKVGETSQSQEMLLSQDLLPGSYFLKVSENGSLKFSQTIVLK
ncbi:MAG: T9SS type A sorting domain-containing protein [Bacteroidota bacterium]